MFSMPTLSLNDGVDGMHCSGVEWNGVDGMHCSGVEWNGVDGSMECIAVECNGMESMECIAVEWNGMDAFWVILRTVGHVWSFDGPKNAKSKMLGPFSAAYQTSLKFELF